MISARRHRNRLRPGSDRGVVAVLTAILVPFMLIMCAIAVDVGTWYVEGQQVQKAADAAALAGVTSMPNEFDQGAAKAVSVSGLNGFPDSGTTSVVPFQTTKSTELGVTVSSTVNNVFGAIMGNPTTTIVRYAVADFTGPAIMGSPCNAFGNQPASNDEAAPPTGTVIPNLAQGGHETCQEPADFWALIEGPQEPKVNGDRYATMTCSNSNDGCLNGVNVEHKKENYFWAVRVQDAAVGTPVTIELYDPAMIDVGQTCTGIPSSGISNNMNPFAPDATSRYARNANDFCSGDSGSGIAMTTSFVLRSQTDTLNPLRAEPISGCYKQFRGKGTAPSANNLTASSGSYNASLAEVFHQWVSLCTFTPTKAGDYYVQVRSNVALPSGTGADTYMTSADNANVVAENGNELDTQGINGFAIRAYISPIELGTSVAVAGYERMPIWVNSSSATARFNLIQVNPNAAGKAFDFSFFDLGDAGGGGTIRVLPPVAATGVDTLGTCILRTPAGTTTNLTNCSVAFTNLQFNGLLRTISVPIPAAYDCDIESLGACWWRVELNYGGSVNDVTTWDASIQGDAVRLVE